MQFLIYFMAFLIILDFRSFNYSNCLRFGKIILLKSIFFLFLCFLYSNRSKLKGFFGKQIVFR